MHLLKRGKKAGLSSLFAHGKTPGCCFLSSESRTGCRSSTMFPLRLSLRHNCSHDTLASFLLYHSAVVGLEWPRYWQIFCSPPKTMKCHPFLYLCILVIFITFANVFYITKTSKKSSWKVDIKAL